MTSLFCTPDRYDKTNVLLLDDGKTYMPIKIIPIGGKEINNSKNHEAGINAFIAGINIESDTRTQFISTLGTDIYAYTFGETLDRISVSGYGYIPCGDGDTSGFKELIDFWSKNNMGRHGLACLIYVDGMVYKAYLVESEIGATDRAMGLFPFRFVFNSLKFI